MIVEISFVINQGMGATTAHEKRGLVPVLVVYLLAFLPSIAMLIWLLVGPSSG